MASRGVSGVDATARRTWDKEHFEKLAKDRAFNENTEEKPIPPEQRTLLKARESAVDLTSALGKSRVVASHNDTASGYYCDVCDCVLKDSISWLDHINGKKHALKQGMSMKVERSSIDQVKARLAEKKRKREEDKARGPVVYNLDARVADLEEQEAARKRQKREAEKQAKLEKEQAATADFAEDADMAALMGFGSFGTSKKS